MVSFAQEGTVFEVGGTEGREAFAVIDLEAPGHIAVGDDTRPVPRLEEEPQRPGNRSHPWRDRHRLGPFGDQHPQAGVGGQVADDVERDGPDSPYLAHLPVGEAAADDGVVGHMHDQHRLPAAEDDESRQKAAGQKVQKGRNSVIDFSSDERQMRTRTRAASAMGRRWSSFEVYSQPRATARMRQP